MSSGHGGAKDALAWMDSPYYEYPMMAIGMLDGAGEARLLAKYGDRIGNLGTFIKNETPIIDWANARVHALNRMVQENLSPETVQSWVNSAKAILQDDGTILYLSKKGAVAIKNGALQTVYSANKYKDHIKDAIVLLFGK
ncbi:hypothetical protein [Cohnella caldifontis]|uniref:hypothetical protein n=1 Tax=Cohnella caldifontis TaxID=3027471 RepID=UPI0023ED1D16|nr:hypothetical protein [Cohnella sp. YIM B05605]